jgi:MFS family permease
LPVATRLAPVRRLAGRALLLFAAYAGVLLAVVIAGFIGQRIGIWASVLWGMVLIGVVALCIRRRRRHPRTES